MFKGNLFLFYFKRMMKDGFTIGYSIIFPLIMIFLLGILFKDTYGKDITSYQYYTITILPFCILCEMITAAYFGQEEARTKVAERFLISPISSRQIIGLKILAGTLALSTCHGFVMFTAFMVWNVSYGDMGFLIFLAYTGLTFLSFSIGLFLGLCMRNFVMIKNFMNIPVLIFGIMAGCFYPLGSLNPTINFLLKLSPLTWLNRSVFLSIYDYNHDVVIIVFICLIVTGFFFSLLAMKNFKKEGYLHGDNFSYQK